jgi:lipopolysaccharide transport system permease protein
MTNVVIIEPGRKARRYWIDLWSYRELFQVLAWRDIAVRYKQTAIGILWAIIRPFLTMLVFTVVFGRLAKLPTDGNAPYALLVFAGMLPWSFFSAALAEASFSLVLNGNLISKVYFPRVIVPVSSVVVAFVDFLVSFAMLLILMAWFHYLPTWRIVFLPAFIALAFLTSIGPVLWIAALNVKYRDFRYLIPFMVQFGLYISPVGFSSNIVPQSWRFVYSLNPMVGVIDGFRWCLLDKVHLYWPGLVTSVLITCLLLWWGTRQFRKLEASFADII